MAADAHLERAVLQALWEQPDPMTARAIQGALDGRELAMTTILTVLDRLRRKGMVARRDDRRPHEYFATAGREEYIAELMLDALGQAPDHGAALSRFLGGVSDTDTDHLRRLLRRPRRRAGG